MYIWVDKNTSSPLSRLVDIVPDIDAEIAVDIPGGVARKSAIRNIFGEAVLVTGPSSYNVTGSESLIFVDASPGDVSINMISAVGQLNRALTIKKISNTGGKVYIYPSSGEAIDNQDCFILSELKISAPKLASDDNNWWIV